MLILCIDASTFTLSVGIAKDDSYSINIISEYTVNTGTPRFENLCDILEFLFKNTNLTLKEIDGLVISIGPGSFTGLRIGLAFAKGLAYSLNKPLVGIPTLDSLANSVQLLTLNSKLLSFHITPLIDAKGGEVYTATYKLVKSSELKIKRITEYEAILPEELIKKLKGDHIFLGNGAQIYKSFFEKEMGKNAHFIIPNIDSPPIFSIAMLGIDRLLKGKSDNIDSLEPIYIHPPRIREKKKLTG